MKGDKEMISFERITKWKFLKVVLSGADQGGTFYPGFRAFTVRELCQYFSLYILRGISPSLRVKMKFKPQRVNCVNGNDFVFNNSGPCVEQRCRHFKSLLACKNSFIETPYHAKQPNWKVGPLLSWMNFIFLQMWCLGVSISVDKITIGFQGRHQDNSRIT